MSSQQKNKSNRLILLAGIVLVALDLGSKSWIFSNNIDTDFITPVVNTGAAWSLNINIFAIILGSVLVLLGLIYMHYKRYIYTVPFILLTSGAIGNIYDRIIFHGVRDRIHIGSFPIFNIADALITLGVILIAFQYKQQSRIARVKS